MLIALGVGTLMLMVLPARADGPTPSDVVNRHIANVSSYSNRIPPASPGTVRRDMSLIFGPFTIPPGWDKNQFTVDLPVQTGFYTRVNPNLVDVTTGKEPTEQEAHIHHAHWFRVVGDGDGYERYEELAGGEALSWVFGTGEERTGGTLEAREADRQADGTEGWKYGIYLDGSVPNVLIFMIHNKTPGPIVAYITLTIDMIYGTRQQIMRATGQDIHPLTGVLTGTTRDIAAAPGDFWSSDGVLRQDYRSDMAGTLVAAGSHMHPGGKWVYVTNLGPVKPAYTSKSPPSNANLLCGGADLDGDGIPGVTLFVSKKQDRVPATWPYSEDYQMGGTQGGFRAPIHVGDVIRQYGVYDVDRTSPPSSGTGLVPDLFRSDPLNPSSPPKYDSLDGQPHAWYAAMSYTGLYVDEYNRPKVDAISDASTQCTAASFEPRNIMSHGFDSLLGSKDGEGVPMSSVDPRATYITHEWVHVDSICGVPDTQQDPNATSAAPCDRTDASDTSMFEDGPEVTQIHVANFVYYPGDLSTIDPSTSKIPVPLIRQGSSVTFVSDDVALGLRHTFTSCPRPCDGPYVANYPLPDGRLETGKLGNLDYIDGGITQDGQSLGPDTLPFTTRTIDFAPGYYNYFCTIHPSMRGIFKVIPA